MIKPNFLSFVDKAKSVVRNLNAADDAGNDLPNRRQGVNV